VIDSPQEGIFLFAASRPTRRSNRPQRFPWMQRRTFISI